MKPMPATMTNRTMKSLTATSTMLTRIDSLMPMLTMHGQHRREQERHQVEARAVADRLRYLDAEVAHEHPEVRRPALRHDGRAQQQLEQQVPADDPRDDLAEAGVGERVGRPADRHRRRELGVAQRGEPAAERGEHERQHDRGPGDLLGRTPGEGEDAGADDDADAEDGQVEGGQPSLELVLRLFALVDRLLDRLGPHHAHGCPPPRSLPLLDRTDASGGRAPCTSGERQRMRCGQPRSDQCGGG